MDFKEDNKFDNYVEKYKYLPLSEKKELVEKEIKELLVVLNSLNEKYGKKAAILFNKEILDIKKENATEDDFVEAMFVYSYSLKELIASLVENLSKEEVWKN